MHAPTARPAAIPPPSPRSPGRAQLTLAGLVRAPAADGAGLAQRAGEGVAGRHRDRVCRGERHRLDLGLLGPEVAANGGAGDLVELQAPLLTCAELADVVGCGVRGRGSDCQRMVGGGGHEQARAGGWERLSPTASAPLLPHCEPPSPRGHAPPQHLTWPVDLIEAQVKFLAAATELASAMDGTCTGRVIVPAGGMLPASMGWPSWSCSLLPAHQTAPTVDRKQLRGVGRGWGKARQQAGVTRGAKMPRVPLRTTETGLCRPAGLRAGKQPTRGEPAGSPGVHLCLSPPDTPEMGGRPVTTTAGECSVEPMPSCERGKA
jgi:hypothetical protein